MSTAFQPVARSGGEILVDALIGHGVDTVFCVPGESFLAVLDAAHDRRDSLRLITCRQEGGAAYMAEAYGKLTGRPGICFVTRGPGACNAAIGVHTALQDSTPMVLLVGQVERPSRGREAFQEVEYRLMFAPLAKWVTEVDAAARLPEVLARAFIVATAGRPGPVVVAVPEDVLTEIATVADIPPCPPPAGAVSEADMAAVRTLLSEARRPLAIIGGPGWDEAATQAFTAFAEAAGLPVATSFRCQDMIDNTSPAYVGELGTSVSPKLAARVRQADLLLVIGARLGDMTTQGYTLVEPPVPHQTLIHIHPAAEELGKVFRPALGLACGVAAAAHGLRRLVQVDPAPWAEWRAAARADYLDGLRPDPCPGPVHLGEIAVWLRDTLPEDAIITTGAGNFTGWPQRFHRFRRFRSQLGPTNGAMGYGLPAAIAASLAEPSRMVLCWAGDGEFLMTGQELATAMMYGLAPIVLVVNNGMYGTIRMHQERRYPGRVSATALVNPDFAALARAYGAHGEVVERTEDFAAAFTRARAAGRAALIELRVDPEAISTRTTLSAIRASAIRTPPDTAS